MICEKQAKRFCRDDIRKIENYQQAINDTTQTWVCHHRLGLTLDGEFAHSAEELMRLGMYYGRPYFELMFLTESEHKKLHRANLSEETRKKISDSLKGENNPMYGKTLSAEHKKKMSESLKGRTGYWTGKKFSAEAKMKMSAARKGKSTLLKGKHWKLVNGKRVYY